MEIGYSNITNQQNTSKGVTGEATVQTGKALAQLSDTSGLGTGKIFQGEILDIKGTQVLIGLDNGQVISAKMEADINLNIGQKLMFEVKENTGTQIQIKPADVSLNPNPVLQKALQEANIPITDRNMDMVSNILKEGLSLDKQSLTSMLRQLAMNPDADTATIVKMSKLGIETTKENITQFDNYKNYEHRIVKDIDNIANNLSKLLNEMSGEDKNTAILINHKVIDILNHSSTINIQTNNPKQSIEIPLEQYSSKQNDISNQIAQEISPKQAVINSNMQTEPSLQEEIKINEEKVQTQEIYTALKQDNTDMGKGIQDPFKSEISVDAKVQDTPDTQRSITEMDLIKGDEIQSQRDINQKGQLLETVLGKEERLKFSETLKGIGADEQQIEQVKEGKLASKELLNMVKDLLSNPSNALKAESLFSSKEYTEILRQEIKQQWLVEPENLKTPNKMESLYQQMEEQTRQLTSILESVGKENSSAFKDVSNIRSNLSFMEQINQNFTYLQIPIQFSNEEAHSDLYVYTNKKNLEKQDGNLSVLLHLDMEVLGTTDIYINMSGKNVSAKFSLKNNQSIEIIENNLDSLIKRLEEKGYHASAQVGKLEKEQEFVEDFLEKDQVVTSLKRYAFDVRA